MQHYVEVECKALVQVRPALQCLLETLIFQRCFQFSEHVDGVRFEDPLGGGGRLGGLAYSRASGTGDVPSLIDGACKQTHRFLDLLAEDTTRREATVRVLFGRHCHDGASHKASSGVAGFLRGHINNKTDHSHGMVAWEEWKICLRLNPAAASLEEQMRALLMHIARECCRLAVDDDSMPMLSSEGQSFAVQIVAPAVPGDGSVSLAGMLKRMILETSTSLFPTFQ